MGVFYFDTSALLKRYRVEERGSNVLEELFANKGVPETFTSSYYTVLESVSAFRRLLRGRVLPQRVYDALVVRLLDEMENHMVVQSGNDDIIRRAMDVVEQYALRAGDALQLATALTVQSASPGERFVFVCSDRELRKAASAAGLEVIDPEHPDAGQLVREMRSSG